MADQQLILEYAPARDSRPFRVSLTPRRVAAAGAAVAALTLLTPHNIGSGIVIVNPLREVGCLLAACCALAYAFMRIWQDRRRGAARAAVYTLCLIGSVPTFAIGHFSIWGRSHLPRMSLVHEYWRCMLIASAFVVVAVLFGALSALYRRWQPAARYSQPLRSR